MLGLIVFSFIYAVCCAAEEGTHKSISSAISENVRFTRDPVSVGVFASLCTHVAAAAVALRVTIAIELFTFDFYNIIPCAISVFALNLFFSCPRDTK